MSKEYDVEYLGGLPLDIRIREQADSGRPTVVSDPDGEVAAMYRQIARRVAVRIAEKTRDMSSKFPAIGGLLWRRRSLHKSLSAVH